MQVGIASSPTSDVGVDTSSIGQEIRINIVSRSPTIDEVSSNL